MTLDTQIADFTLKRVQIEKLNKEVEKGKLELDQWVMSTDMCKNWMKKANELEKLKETYKAEMKAAFGLADGERADVLEIVQAIKKVSNLD